ncbi:FecR domain-containing protein [Fulvimonas sp. R45]|uniref:DUF6600 domain-containing protein n=1 Tax=Fulvimonas sp. R45 TaxID=3045937 RepID=UPI00265F4D88|nr:DUF6600 domain-containing protein [Fulvimonas sp. R45]MDO1528159.1 FecR domain-containing protein [Fulvimonas sp. R45]
MRVFTERFVSRRHWLALAGLLLLGLAAGPGRAQSADDTGAAPPDRVARLSYVAGDLGFQPAGAQDWGSADVNRPLTTGDRLSTGDGARAELELGGGSLRMAGDTDVGLLNLDDNLAQLELTRGTLNLGVRRLDPGQSYEIDTPTVALVVNSPGTYRVDVDGDGNGTRVEVFDGQATVYGENGARHDVFAGRSYRFDDASLGMVSIADLGGGDAFDAWCTGRDRRYAQSATSRYVSTDVVGYQDLDDYGDWRSDPGYGEVWYPRDVAADWAPYRDGHWAWIAPWGWTWVDDSPWGFAPYHYGRWAWIGGAWGWIPGPAMVRPVYAPALVAFVGGAGWRVSLGFGPAPVGWFPLGPGEVYNPWYRCDRAYYQRVNITNIRVRNIYNRTTIINDIDNHYRWYRAGRPPRDGRYVDRDRTRGFTAMPGRAFASGERVPHGRLHVDPRTLAAAPVLTRGVGMPRPEPRASTAWRAPHARTLPVAGFRRAVVAHTPPPAALAAATHAAMRGERGPAAPFTNVRVLGHRGAAPPAAGRPPARPAGAWHDTVHPIAAGRLPVAPRFERAEPLRPGELPSARFAHPSPQDRGWRPGETARIERRPPTQGGLRPGVSFIGGPTAYRPPAGHRDERAPMLPQPPHFERLRQAPPAPSYTRAEPVRPVFRQPPRIEPMREPAPRPAWRPQPELQRASPPAMPRYQPSRPAEAPRRGNNAAPARKAPAYREH